MTHSPPPAAKEREPRTRTDTVLVLAGLSAAMFSAAFVVASVMLVLRGPWW